tara:strand:+ start:67 stop:645 length:579 start_codon:yes stop_codon:yes gene_type:complete
MTAQEVKFANFYESTLNGVLASGATSGTLTAAPTSNGTSNISVPYYLVIDPDNASTREVVEVTAASGTTLSTIVRDKEGRHTSDPTHADGTVVRMAVVKEMFEDLHDRIDAGVTASSTTTFTNKTIDADATGNSITNIEDANIKAAAAIDAAKIHNGTISNTEFGYLNGVSSAIQTQIDGKASIGLVIALGG